MKLINKNRRAFYDYEIGQRFEAGISLLGSEIKSIRASRVTLKGSFISLINGQAVWKGGLIQPWEHQQKGSGHDERRERPLLLKKKELKQLTKAMEEKGFTIIPIALGLVRGRAKLEIALAKGKKQYDKRHTIKARDIERRDLRNII